ncbi:MFS transporter [Citrobacter amalonaticus]|uniref:MFS transporter n=1 Tax=Citrobacter amalonaticus TaxID=35703 RepID=A0A2S4RVD0_CITAM|nr:MFS transporter [Citrobacter amalonaticus]POT55669.1 MFS transporter [Citrobacter amalonaticus]POT73882.1 MFS transporter [Citrobacter amalonaticus]POU64106.1 MFS transporter [Citrobacter amalonaticus]POV03738.1 MFS transporter [Citrobacter amalonaticus]
MNKNLTLLGVVFFLWGNITAINSVLIVFFYQYFHLAWQQSILMTVIFYIAPFLTCLPCSALIERWGYRAVLLLSLALSTTGCLMLALALQQDSFALSLMAMFVVATGVAAMQVVANPYLTLLSAPHKRIGNLCLASAVNSLGTTLAPVLVALLLEFSPVDILARKEPVSTLWLYLAGFSLILIAGVFVLHLPDVAGPKRAASGPHNFWKNGELIFSVAAIFVYVGVEVTLAISLVKYLITISGWSTTLAMSLVSFYWGGALAGRFLYGLLAEKVGSYYPFLAATLACAATVVLAMCLNNTSGGYLLLLTGLGNSILYPIIFGHTINKNPAIANISAAAMVMAGIGGAVIPWLQAICIDEISLRMSFVLPVALYLLLTLWGRLNLRPSSR